MTLPVVKEELLSLQDSSFGKDSNAVVSVHHYDCNSSKQNLSQNNTASYCERQKSDELYLLPFHNGCPTFCVAVGINRMVCKANFIPLSCGIHNKV